MPEKLSKSKNQGIYKRLLEAYEVRNPSELARRLKVKPQSIYPLRDGENAPSLAILIAANRDTGRSLDWIINGSETAIAKEEDIKLLFVKMLADYERASQADRKLVHEALVVIAGYLSNRQESAKDDVAHTQKSLSR